MLRLALYLLLLAEVAACAPATSPAGSAQPHGATVVTESNLSGFGSGEGPRGPSDVRTSYDCPEADSAQPNCRVPR